MELRKEKGCEKCKYRVSEVDGIGCEKHNIFISSLSSKKMHCKYYKRDQEYCLANGQHKYYCKNGKEYKYVKGKMKISKIKLKEEDFPF